MTGRTTPRPNYAARERERRRIAGVDPYLIVPLPRAGGGAAHVLVDGRHYASFRTRADAVSAVQGWREFWPAVEGLRLEIDG